MNDYTGQVNAATNQYSQVQNVSAIRDPSVSEAMQAALSYLEEAAKVATDLRYKVTGNMQGESASNVPAPIPTMQSLARDLSTSAACLLGDLRTLANLL